MSENVKKSLAEEYANESVKELADALKKVNISSGEIDLSETNENAGSINEMGSSFKVASSNLPAKPSIWTKVKNALFYEIKVELTPYQQKVEDEINEFLHQEITWSSFKSFLLQEVPITYKGKRVF